MEKVKIEELRRDREAMREAGYKNIGKMIEYWKKGSRKKHIGTLKNNGEIICESGWTGIPFSRTEWKIIE